MEIRVGQDEEEWGNNEMCFEQIEFVNSSAASITCMRALFGDLIIIKKLLPNVVADYVEMLMLQEVHVFDSKYYSAHR